MDKTQAPASNAAGLILEQNQRLSRSLLWQFQRTFFDQQGVEAWRRGLVPYYVTSNPFIARAYARVVFGFLRDCAALKEKGTGFAPLYPSQPVYIVELGAGSGRFGAHFLKRLLDFMKHPILNDVRVQYVMTDFTERNIAYWQAHPALQPLVEAGQLDFARFDAGNDQELVLRHSGAVLSPGTVKNPLVVIANYCFDSLPQDVFTIADSQLYESLITLHSSQPVPDQMDQQFLAGLEITHEHVPATADYYDDPDLNHVLKAYQERLPNTFLLFPYAAFQCLRTFARLSAGRLLLLSGDKGYSREEDLIHRDPPEIAIHGSFSMMVNHHALGQFVLRQGGQFLFTPHRHTSLDICAFLLGQPPGGYVETRLAYTEAIENGGPDDFYTLREGIRKHYNGFTLGELLAYLRLSGWDADLFLECFPALMEQAKGASPALREEFYWALQHIWDTYYPIGEWYDVAFCIGLLYHAWNYYPEALRFFQVSLQLYGAEAATAHNIGLCYYALGQVEEALAWINQALTIDPLFQPAKELRLKIQAQLQRAGTRLPGTTPADILAFQSTIGNRAVQRLIQGTVSGLRPGSDGSEAQAERVTHQIASDPSMEMQ